MNKKIIAPILSISLLGLVSVGTTFALFTSNDEANVAVTAGKVKVSAKLSNLELYSASTEDTDETGIVIPGSYDLGEFSNDYYFVKQDSKFVNGGTASLSSEGGLLTLTNVAPGDKVTFDLKMENNSNIDIKYRVRAFASELTGYEGKNLFSALDFEIDGFDYSGVESIITPWKSWTIGEATSLTLSPISVTLPINTSNDYQENGTDITFVLEAVQGNASVNNFTADVQYIDSINKMLIREELDFPTQALIQLDDEYRVDLLEIENLVWNSKHNLFGINETGLANYGTCEISPVLDENVWMFKETYSNVGQPVYLLGNEVSGTLNISTGLDVGENYNIELINYTNLGEAQSAVIRTNSSRTELVVNAPNDTVKHYDSVGTVHIIAVDSLNCYEENGKAAFTQMDSGKYKTSILADVELLYVSDSNKVSVSVVPGTVDHAHAFNVSEANVINATHPGVTFDYDENAEQNERVDVYHHVSDAGDLPEGEIVSPKIDFQRPLENASEEEIKEAFEHNKEIPVVVEIVTEAIQEECDHEFVETHDYTNTMIENVKNGTLPEATKNLLINNYINQAKDGYCDVYNIIKKTCSKCGYETSEKIDDVKILHEIDEETGACKNCTASGFVAINETTGKVYKKLWSSSSSDITAFKEVGANQTIKLLKDVQVDIGTSGVLTLKNTNATLDLNNHELSIKTTQHAYNAGIKLELKKVMNGTITLPEADENKGVGTISLLSDSENVVFNGSVSLQKSATIKGGSINYVPASGMTRIGLYVQTADITVNFDSVKINTNVQFSKKGIFNFTNCEIHTPDFPSNYSGRYALFIQTTAGIEVTLNNTKVHAGGNNQYLIHVGAKLTVLGDCTFINDCETKGIVLAGTLISDKLFDDGFVSAAAVGGSVTHTENSGIYTYTQITD